MVFPLMNSISGADSQVSPSLSTDSVVRKDGGNNFLSILKGMDKKEEAMEILQETFNDDEGNPAVASSRTAERQQSSSASRNTQTSRHGSGSSVSGESQHTEIDGGGKKNVNDGDSSIKNSLISSRENGATYKSIDGEKDGFYKLKEYDASSGQDKDVLLRKLTEMGPLPKAFNVAQTLPEVSSQVSVADSMRFTPAKDLIHQIVNYMALSKAANQHKLDVIVNHAQLGRFELGVMRRGSDPIELSIATSTSKGYQFFNEHGAELSKALNKIGVSLRDIKIVDDMDTANKDFFVWQDEALYKDGHEDEDAHARKRKYLWEKYREYTQS